MLARNVQGLKFLPIVILHVSVLLDGASWAVESRFGLESSVVRQLFLLGKVKIMAPKLAESTRKREKNKNYSSVSANSAPVTPALWSLRQEDHQFKARTALHHGNFPIPLYTVLIIILSGTEDTH